MPKKNHAPRRGAHGARPSRSRRRQTRRKGVVGAGALAVFLACAGIAAARYDAHSGAGVAPQARTQPAPAGAPDSTASPPASPSASPAPSSTSFPERGTGTFVKADGGTKVFGRGRLLRYAVDVEGGIGQDPAEFARQVDAVLDNTTRGWAAGGLWSFQRVSSGPVDFTVHLASPGTTDTLCAKYGLDTGGWVNCSGGNDVVINVKRWLELTPYYQGQPDLYHALAINHEVGHRLGHNHVTCPGPGQPAPVMMQQIKGLHGCVINGWPYDANGHLLTGPPA